MTIDYTYDPLNRLTAADYSTGDYYHYTYDSVGNRLSQEDMVGGQPSAVNYVYDDANRLSTVNGAAYTFDDNGNLLSDGVNSYSYDSANRLISVNGTENYAYNGLGDRLTQNGTQYTLDLNAGLTQVLSDGENSYMYGLGRISQTNSETEYFLGDALGSVRQLTDSTGGIALVNAYEPYGNSVTTFGTGESAYGFTGETTDVNGLIYLRARYYSSGAGRFLSRDTWGGDYNLPQSLNKWNYTQSNPINYADPSGNFPICSYEPSKNVPSLEKIKEIRAIPKWDWLNTYAIAGIAVQCWAIFVPNNDPYDGRGPGQITDKEKESPYGERIPDPSDPTNKKKNRGYGLCKESEEPRDQNDIKWAVEYMKRRIKIVTDACIAAGCSSTDVYIAAALAQNGPGFTIFNLQDWLLVEANRIHEDDLTIDWYQWFDNGSDVNTSRQLSRFEDATDALKTRYIPRNVNFETIHKLQGY